MVKIRRVVWMGSAAALLAALGLWLGTGGRAWTRFPSEGIAGAQGEPDGGGLGDLFADAGLHDDHGELEEIDNAFRFGLLPSGAGREGLSVASVSGVAVAASVGVWWWGRRERASAAPTG